MMTKRIGKAASALICALSLTACAGLGPTYSVGEFDSTDFVENYYAGYDDYEGEAISEAYRAELQKDPDSEDPFYFGGSDLANSGGATDVVQNASLKDGRYASMFQYGTDTLSDDTGFIATGSDDIDEEALGTDFGYTKCLSTLDSSFKSVGALSKLYNGQTRCYSTGSKGRVQIDQAGFRTKLPKKMTFGQCFLISCRGATDYEPSTQVDVIVDILVTFYKESESYVVKMSNVTLACDGAGAGEQVSYIGFSLKDDAGFDPVGIDGYGISFTLKSTPHGGIVSADASAEAETHFAVMLYEVMFPNSLWA
jgi:hypothetical protein